MGTAIQDSNLKIKHIKKQMDIANQVLETIENIEIDRISKYYQTRILYTTKLDLLQVELKKLKTNRINILKIA